MTTTKLLLLFSLTFLLTSCSLVSPASQPTTPTADSPPPASGEESVRDVVERFGKKLQMVSLQSPNAGEEIREQYFEFVSSELLERWVHDPSLAPGRIVSSPWPDRIEIASITKKEPGQYIANGFVVEVTSMELVSGGAARKVPVQITLQNMQGRWVRWVITEYTQTTTAQQPQSTQAPTPTTVQPTPTQLLLQQTPTVLPLIGPVPYPTPQAEIIPWEQLINQALIQNVSWSQYQGEIQANEKGLLWPYTFQYPSDWYLTANPNPTHVFVQNIPESQGAPQGDFAKFEILRLKEPPLLESEPPNSQDFRTITIAGERGVVTVLTQIPGKSRAISAVFQHKGVWFAISGYITLPTESIENLERYTAMLLSMLASFTLEGSP